MDEGKTVDRVLVEVTIAAPAEQVWAAMRDAEQIKQWFGWDAETLPAEIDYIFFQYGDPDEATHTLGFKGMGDRFEVRAEGAGRSVVRLIRPGPADEDWENIFSDTGEGWIAFLHQLRLMLERHAGEPRRTIFHAGTADGEYERPTAALGLGDRPVGSEWSAELAGERLSGTVSHRTPFQLGLVVREWNDGLLVAIDLPPEKGVGGSMTLTTYGLGDSAFNALAERWKAWWTARYPQTAQPCAEAPVPEQEASMPTG